MAGKKMNVEKKEKFSNVLIISGLAMWLLQADGLLYCFCLGAFISPYTIILNFFGMFVNIFAGISIQLSRESKEKLKRILEKRTDNINMVEMSNEIAELKMENEDLRKSLDEETLDEETLDEETMPSNNSPKEEVVGRKMENAMEGLEV